MINEDLKIAIKKSGKALYNSLPILLGVVFLVGLVSTLVPKSFYINFFSKNIFADSFLGGILGSIMAGNPVTSYVLGGELLDQGVSLVAVTAFLISWVTVGFVQFPAESVILGRRFAFWRNILSFIFSVIIAVITYYILILF